MVSHPTYSSAELVKLASFKKGVVEWYKLLLAHFLRLSKGGTQAARQHSNPWWWWPSLCPCMVCFNEPPVSLNKGLFGCIPEDVLIQIEDSRLAIYIFLTLTLRIPLYSWVLASLPTVFFA